jgi:hypothetical protein
MANWLPTRRVAMKMGKAEGRRKKAKEGHGDTSSL